MRALSVLNPWADLIVSQAKTIENRTWRTNYRGPLAIHAGKSRRLYAGSGYGRPAGIGAVAEVFLERYGCRLPLPDEVAFGAIVGVVELLDCVPLADLPPDLAGSRFAEGPWCWILGSARRIEPIPCLGQQQLWIPAQMMPNALASA